MKNKDTKEKEKSELTKEDIARMNLEYKLYQGILGSNLIRSNPTELGSRGLFAGESAYNSFMNSKEIQEEREKNYQSQQQEANSLGVFGDLPRESNTQSSYRIMKQLEEYKQVLSLKDLEKIVKLTSPGFKFNLPEDTKNLTAKDLMIKKYVEKKELSEVEEKALIAYTFLNEAYNDGIKLTVFNQHYFDELNMKSEQFAEKYAIPKEDKKLKNK